MPTAMPVSPISTFPGVLRLQAKQEKIDIVVIDDDENIVEFLSEIIPQDVFRVFGATQIENGYELVERIRPAIVLLDLRLPGVNGFEALEHILGIDSGIDVIMVTGSYSPEAAVDAIHRGACDYMTKPLSVERLRQRLQSLLHEATLRKKACRADKELLETFQCAGIIGRSAAVLDVFSRMRRIAPHFQTVLVTGDTGTGKELIAKALHALGPRAKAPFVTCNCAAIPEHLFESELFGHVRGAFTGAVQDRVGFVKAAHGGTLFLDEIGELPLHLQSKVLRLLQSREIQRVGDSRPERVDVRVIAATNKDLRSLVKEHKLRDDLYYRLSSVEVRLPRLAERKEDLPLLIHHFLDLYASRYGRDPMSLTRRAQAALAHYSWPGNIRELENVIASCCMMSEGSVIDIRHLPPEITDLDSIRHNGTEGRPSMAEMHLRHAQHVLEHVRGNRVQAASLLGISRATLYRLLASANA